MHRKMKSLRTDPNLHRHQECIEKWNMEIFSCLPKISPFLANSVTRYSMLLVSITCGCRNHTWGLVGKAKKAKKHPKESLFLWFSPKAVEVLPHTWNCHNPPMRANKIIKSFTEKNPPVPKVILDFRTVSRYFGFISTTSEKQFCTSWTCPWARALWIWFCILFMNWPESPKRLLTNKSKPGRQLEGNFKKKLIYQMHF